eukprot:m.70841 g.70841  ORF g.70841 m.70841 type:complete len:699 (+) comp12173_c0_seq1:61-2157(+)
MVAHFTVVVVVLSLLCVPIDMKETDNNCSIVTSLPFCSSYPGLSSLPLGPFAIHDSFPMPYFVTAPCHNLTAQQTNCTSFNNGDDASPVFAYSQGICYALGHLSDVQISPLDMTNASAGVLVTYGNGVGDRAVQYVLSCDESVSPTAGPTHAIGDLGGDLTLYQIIWPTPHACNPVKLPAAACSGSIPKPTPDQLLFQEMELGALICYNMATTAGLQGCHPHTLPASSVFTNAAPKKPDTDQWCKAIASFGGKYATIVAKHVCGFAIWPTKARLPAINFTYEYYVGPDRDIVRDFAESCSAVGVKLGIYYSVVSNEYLNVEGGAVRDPSTLGPGQVAVTQDQYADIVSQQLTELWTNYGDLAEIWFDGGFSVGGLQDQLLALLNKTQPHAAIFNGCGLSSNAVGWIGTESGHAPYPIWNTDTGCTSSGGSINGKMYLPREVDLTLQRSDTWFYNGIGYRSLGEMISIYHDSVGHGGNMLLNVAPAPNSSLPDEAMNLYASLGSFIQECYGNGDVPSAHALGSIQACTSNCSTLTISFGAEQSVDRFLIKEELSQGQLIISFEIVDSSGETLFNGSSVGRSVIALLPQPVNTTSITLRVTESKANPQIRLFAVPNPAFCNAGNSSGSPCSLSPNVFVEGLVFQTAVLGDVADCCNLCRQNSTCAVFNTVAKGYSQVTCTLLSAYQGSKIMQGAISGSPN